MGVIQGAVNQMISGTAYIQNTKKAAEIKQQKAAEAADNKARKKADIVREAYSKNAQKGWATRRANAEARMRDSLMEKADAKRNGIETVKRVKGGGANAVQSAEH